MSKMKFDGQWKQSRMIEGVCVPIGHYGGADYDELLREALRVALRTDLSPPVDDWDDLYTRIRTLMAAYIESPEGRGESACVMMTRLAACIADIVPVAMRRELVTLATSYESKHPYLRVPDIGREVMVWHTISADDDEQV